MVAMGNRTEDQRKGTDDFVSIISVYENSGTNSECLVCHSAMLAHAILPWQSPYIREISDRIRERRGEKEGEPRDRQTSLRAFSPSHSPSYTRMMASTKGPSINDVTQIFGFLGPPLSAIETDPQYPIHATSLTTTRFGQPNLPVRHLWMASTKAKKERKGRLSRETDREKGAFARHCAASSALQYQSPSPSRGGGSVENHRCPCLALPVFYHHLSAVKRIE